jgi:hypothetical protein
MSQESLSQSFRNQRLRFLKDVDTTNLQIYLYFGVFVLMNLVLDEWLGLYSPSESFVRVLLVAAFVPVLQRVTRETTIERTGLEENVVSTMLAIVGPINALAVGLVYTPAYAIGVYFVMIPLLFYDFTRELLVDDPAHWVSKIFNVIIPAISAFTASALVIYPILALVIDAYQQIPPNTRYLTFLPVLLVTGWQLYSVRSS